MPGAVGAVGVGVGVAAAATAGQNNSNNFSAKEIQRQSDRLKEFLKI